MAKLLALCAVVFLTACGSSGTGSESTMRVSESAERLISLLQANGVPVPVAKETKAAPLAQAWKAFGQFAALDVSAGDIQDDPMADAFLFEAGTFDLGDRWGRSFTLSFVRQYGMKDDDIQQVHLVAYFPPTVFDEIRTRIKIESCADGFQPAPVADCAGLCMYAGQTALLGSPCRLVPSSFGGRPGSTLDDLTVWSYQTGGDGPGEQRETWLASVDSSLILQYALESRKLLGYEVWQGSVE